jgi:hypothetical protein
MDNNKKRRDNLSLNGDRLDLVTIYPAGQDIYANAEKTSYQLLDEETAITEPRFKIREWHEEEYKPVLLGGDLDIPASELDDMDEIAGEEDEENNYYSIGGDDHSDLEEDKGE